MPAELLTTVQAAGRAAVTPSTIKRWADLGILPCVRTPGGHRRFHPADVDRLLRSGGKPGPADGAEAGAFLERLVGAFGHEVEGSLLDMRGRLGSWHAVADALAPVIAELGLRWEDGRLSVAEEHIAAECLGRTLARLSGSLPGRPGGPRCLLACAEGDEHTLGLSLAELCLRELGWTPVWLGRRTPATEVAGLVQAGGARLVALSASASSREPGALAAVAKEIGAACRDAGVGLVLGGSGAWPDRPSFGVRLHTFGQFHDYLARLGSAPPEGER